MSITNSSQHELSIVAESTYGTTPASPVFKRTPITACNLGLTKGVINSEVIVSNRQLTDSRHGNRQVGGDISVEFAYGTFDTMLEALFCGTWTSNVLVPGTTRRSFSVLRQFTDHVAPLLGFHMALGVELNTLALTIAPEALVKGVFGCLGRELQYADAAPAGTTYTAASGNKAFDSYTGTITLDGTPLAIATEISLNIENGLEPRFVLFDDRTQRPKIGKTMVTGTLTTYFENTELLVAFSAAERLSLEFEMTDLDGNSYTVLLPSLQFNGGQPDVSGEADITLKIPFTAIYETGAGTPDTIKVTRTPA